MLWLLAVTLPPATHAHRGLPDGVVCGNQFSSPADALVIPNPKISWAVNRIVTCDAPVMWLAGDMDAGFLMEFTMGVPVLERFESVRLSVVVIGPGLPALVDNAGVVPAEVAADIGDGEGAVLFESPQDQSSCAHLKSGPMGDSTQVTDGRCHFHEEYGDSHSWTLLDENLAAPASGTYRFAVFVSTGTTAKMWFACCAWPEDFQTPYDYPEADCPYCGTKKSFTSFASLFYEQRHMEVHAGFPALQDCTADPGPPAGPTEAQCPDENVAGVARQPESCKLGCVNGECHSHNIFGECTYELEWRVPHPTLNGAKVTKMLLFVGDKVVFKKGGEFDHNLIDMKTAAALDNCDFTTTSEAANVEEVRSGHMIEFMTMGMHFYSCTFPNHCTMGQILTVDVKSAAEGMICHADHPEPDDHGHDHGHDHDDHDDHHGGHEHVEASSTTSMECPPPMVTGRLIGTYAKSYGADSGECAEMCTSENAMQWMTGVVKASCADETAAGGAFPEFVISKEVLPNPRSPPMTVHIHRKKLPCHCHSYEEIECNAPGSSNPLYDEHIDEITEHCAGVLDGTITDCPYKCFQPFEVLHLHYMECSLRPKDALFLQIEATDLCHQASRPPAGTTCTTGLDIVTDGDDDNDDDDDDDDDDSDDTESVAAAGLMLAVVLVQ